MMHIGVCCWIYFVHLSAKVDSTNIIVSQNERKSDAKHCGTLHLPCATIEYAVKKIAEAGDTISIDGGNVKDSYSYYINKSIAINKPLSIQPLHYSNPSRQHTQTPSIIGATGFLFDKRNPVFFVMTDFNVTGIKISMVNFINAMFIMRGVGGRLNLQSVVMHYDGDGIPFQVLRGNWDIRLLRCTYHKPARNYWTKNLPQNADVDITKRSPPTEQVNLIVEDTLLIRYTHVFITTNGNLTSYYRNVTFVEAMFVESTSNMATIANCTLRHSSIILQFIGHAIITNVIFDGNSYPFMQLTITKVKNAEISKCVFKNSNLGVLDIDTSHVKMIQTNVTNNCQSAILTRKSNLNFIQSNVEIMSCHFENNTSTAVTAGTLSFMDINSEYGDYKHLTITRTKIIGASSVTVNSVFDVRLSGVLFTVSDGSIFSCPLNNYYNYYEDDSSRNFAFTCTHCQWRTYNVMQLAEMVWNDTIRRYEHYNSACLPCPYAAVCETKVKSKGCYWGYIGANNSLLQFIPCPFSYCCSSLKLCQSYNSCNKHRQGRLCNECETGFSVSLFGSFDCIKTSQCHKWYFWYLFILIAFVYLIIIMYLKDMAIFLKRLTGSKHSNFNNTEIIADERDIEISDDDDNVISRCLLDSSEIERSVSPYVQVICNEDVQSNVYIRESVFVAGIIKILFFFYQAASIIRIESPSKQLYYTPWLFDALNSFFNVRIQSTSSFVSICPILNGSIVQVGLLKSAFLFACPLLFLVMFAITSHALRLKRSNHESCNLMWYSLIDEHVPSYFKLPFLVRIKCTYVQLVLLSFSSIATCLIESVNCVEILGVRYLYIQASTRCYTWWQYVIITIIILWVILFPFCLHIGCRLLYKCSITPVQFLLLITFPPLTLWYVLKENYYPYHEHVLYEPDAIEAKNLLGVINEPFRRREEKRNKSKVVVWEPVLILRRLLLVIVNVLLIEPFHKIFPSGMLLVIYLVHHVFTQPFNDARLNRIETISLSTLCFLSMTNIFWGFSGQLDMENSSALRFVGKLILYFEYVMLCLPFFVLLVIVSVVVMKRLYKRYIQKQN